MSRHVVRLAPTHRRGRTKIQIFLLLLHIQVLLEQYWMWLISSKWNYAKKWKWTNAKRRNDIDTVGVRAGCVLTAFEDSSFNGDQVLALHLRLHHSTSNKAALHLHHSGKKLIFSTLTFAFRSPSELILVIGEKHQLWFISPFIKLNWIQFMWKIPLLQMGSPCTDPRLWAHARRNRIGQVRLLSDIIVLLKLNRSLSNWVFCVKYTSTNYTYHARCPNYPTLHWWLMP